MGGGGHGDESEASSPAAAAAATLHIRCSNGSKFSVQADLAATVAAFKELVAGSCDVPAPQQRLIYKGRILKDEQTLSSYGVESDHTIHLVRGAAPSNTPSTAAHTANLGSSGPNNASTAGAGISLFPGPGVGGSADTRSAGLLGMPDQDMMQQQLAQNPNLMRDLMNLPFMQNILNNPELMRSIIMNNPQMRELIDRNPDLAHVLNDPSILRQTIEAARNPEIMREMMRNTDRAMSNIEASPEGFNMLRRMYETVQEPFLNATTMAGEGNANANPFAALLGNQGTNQTRDQATNVPATGSESTTGSPVPNTNPLPNPWSTNSGGAPAGVRTNSTSNTRTAGTGGLWGSALPDLDRMMGGMPDASVLSQVMQNPAMMQMMQNMLSDPQAMNQLLNFNPNVRSLLDSNTQLREMFQNPDIIRQLMSPETLQQLLTFQQTFMSQMGQLNSQGQNQTGGAAQGLPSNTGIESLMTMLGGLGTGGLVVPNTSNAPPEELYATQLSQLQEMGFFDTQENITALIATAGNVHLAVERLLGNLGH